VRAAALLAVVFACVGLALAVAPAFAVVTHPFLKTFDGSGTPNGTFFTAGRATVDQGSGDVYVLDVGAAAVEVFDSEGTFLREITGADTPAESFAFSRVGSSAVAVDASGGLSDGDVYVADTRNDVVDVFDSTGLYERQLTGLVAPTGLAVDDSGHLWVAESGDGASDNGMVHEFDSAGNEVQSWPDHYFSTEAIAVDSTSRVYLISGASEVTRWTSTGGDETSIASDATGIAVGPNDDHVYVLQRQFVSELDEDAAPVNEFGSGPLNNSFGIAINGATGNVYVTNSIPPRQVSVFGPLATLADVDIGPATDVTTTGATLHGTINPQGLAATYQFEWGTDTNYGNFAPADPVDAGDGTADVPATADLSGLTPGTTYHYRLRGTNDDGSNFSQDGSFTTLSPPRIVSQSATAGLDFATLTAQVNPAGDDTTYHFEYGPDDNYGTSTPETPLGGGSDDLTAAADISGLSPAKTYHFRVVATNVNGTTTGDDATFSTSPPPSITLESVSDIGLDGATLHAWIYANGEETTYQFQYGPTDAYGSVSPAAPASIGSSHDKQVVNAVLAGLAPGTTYHYRVVASSAAGVSTGSDRTFTTRTPPCVGACGQPEPPDTGGGPPPAGGGGGSTNEPPKTSLKVGSITRKQRAGWARTGVLRLRVRVGGRGRVSARALATLPGHFDSSTVARDSKAAAAAGVVTLRLKLSRAAMDALAEDRLPVTIVVRSTGAARSARVRLTLSSPARR
jgi:hypothetical protein